MQLCKPDTWTGPDFDYFRAVITGECQAVRPVLFEHYIEWPFLKQVLGQDRVDMDNPPWDWITNAMMAYARMGYDTLHVPLWRTGLISFPHGHRQEGASVSQNEGGVILSWDDFHRYPWPDPTQGNYQYYLDGIQQSCPNGMKILIGAPEGVYDNLVNLMGFETLCIATLEQPDLVTAICREIGIRTLEYFNRAINHPVVGGIIVTDDWGFKTSTFLSPQQLREFVFPWHKAYVDLAHNAGKIAILHSCGQIQAVMNDVIDSMKYDAKHSFEDVITPVESILDLYGHRIGILGGLDVDFLSRATPRELADRGTRLLNKTRTTGRYALGSGNSIADGIPHDNFAKLLHTAWEFK